MELTVASWLVSEEASPARRLASSEADPGSLAAATRMRAYVSPDRAAAVLEHETLRRRAARKFGAELSGWFWTPQGLEPVSYTHLDVYKRQTEECRVSCRSAHGGIQIHQQTELKQLRERRREIAGLHGRQEPDERGEGQGVAEVRCAGVVMDEAENEHR